MTIDHRERIAHPRSFDHSAIATHPALAAVAAAIDALASSDVGIESQEALAEVVAAIALAVPYGALCPACRAMAYPVELDVVRPSWLAARYYHCGRYWRRVASRAAALRRGVVSRP